MLNTVNLEIEKAECIFQGMCPSGISPNNITYTVMISGYCELGDMEKSAKLLDKMVGNGITPDYVTYSVLQSGYSKEGKFSI